MFPRHLKKRSKKIKHVDTVVNSIQTFPLAVARALLNSQNNPVPTVDCYRNNSSKNSCAYQDVVSDKISH